MLICQQVLHRPDEHHVHTHLMRSIGNRIRRTNVMRRPSIGEILLSIEDDRLEHVLYHVGVDVGKERPSGVHDVHCVDVVGCIGWRQCR